MQTINHLYDDHATARKVLEELERSGVATEDISLLASETAAHYPSNSGVIESSTRHVAAADSHGTANGAMVGGAIGAGAGILAAIGSLAIPGLGPLVAAGVLATALATATGGAVAGGLIGALTSYGIEERDAQVYAEGIRRGGTLVSVRTSDERAVAVEAIMTRHDPINTTERRQAYSEKGWSTYDPAAPVYTRAEIERDRVRYPL